MSSFLSRATSIRSTSSKKKASIEAKGRPADELLARFLQFKVIIKSLEAYYTGVKTSEQHHTKELTAQSKALPVPFETSQFIQEGNGFQTMFYSLRDHSKAMADMHNLFAHAIDKDVLTLLNEAHNDIKTHIHSLETELLKQADAVDKERELSQHALGEHSKGVSLAGSDKGLGHQNHNLDPFITQGVTERQLLRQLDQENKLTRATIHYQESSERFEAQLVLRIQRASENFTHAQATHSSQIQDQFDRISQALKSVPADAEWKHFADPNLGRLVDPATTMRDPALLTFPDQNHERSQAIKKGLLERKKRHTKSYAEYYLVLTASGFLHCYPNSGIIGDDPKAYTPELSLYLPEAELGAPAETYSPKHKFVISVPRVASSGKQASSGFRKNKEVAFTFKARNHSEMMSWWEAVKEFTRRSLPATTSNPTTPQKGQIGTGTVAGVGLASSQNDAASTYTTDTVSPSVQREAEEAHGPVSPHSARSGIASDSDNESIGGSSIEEERAQAASLAGSKAPTIIADPHTNASVNSFATARDTTHQGEVGSAVTTDESTQLHSILRNTSIKDSQSGLAEAIPAPAYTGDSHGYPADKKIQFQDQRAAVNPATSSSSAHPATQVTSDDGQ